MIVKIITIPSVIKTSSHTGFLTHSIKMAPPLIKLPWMAPKPVIFLTVLLLQTWMLAVHSVELSLFYPFGPEHKDTAMKAADDASSIDVRVQEEFHFYNNSYRNIYVNTNGHISFDSEFPAYRVDMALPLGYHLVAPFYADVDTRATGRIYYRNTTDSDVIQRAAADIQTYFSGFPNYMPTTLFIVTWDRVGYFNSKSDKTNTFQLILASDGKDTFALFHYLSDGINWMQSDGKFTPNYPDIPPQAGFDGGEGGNSFMLPGSGDDGSFVTGSNVNVPGVWMFHIGNILDGNVKPADQNTEEVTVFKPKTQNGCANSGKRCHRNAECVETINNEFCCQCIPPFYGNGIDCLMKGHPHTIDGRVYGRLNGIRLATNAFMHTYVVTNDGRSYSAMSQVPPSMTTGMQTLNSIGGIIGWLFAVPLNPNAKNGYMLTGAKFNRTARVTFKSTDGQPDKVVYITQVFFGHDARNRTRMETQLDGELPDFPRGASVKIDDYMEDYNHQTLGQIKSSAKRTYRIDGVARQYTWENTINFEECDNGELVQAPVYRLSVGKHYVRHNDQKRVVGYAMTSKIGLAGETDPCASLGKQCHKNAECVSRGDSHQCVCQSGYYGNGITCLDVDECRQNICDRNARCQNLPGSYRCQCNAGYRGNGRSCEPEVDLCGSYVCDANARCVFNSVANERMCQCNPGYRGDGQRCAAVETNCRNADICGENAQCVYDDVLREYVCECQDDFSGDGYSCEAVDPGCNACDRNAECVQNSLLNKESCECMPGYTGNGRECSMIDICSKCDRRAQCVFDDRISQYRCVCERGWRGDGETCARADCRNVTGMCAAEGGLCWLNPATSIAICRCNIGYRGDGFRCEKVGCDVYNDCDSNAKCVQEGREYVCQCNEGFSGTGRRCRPDTESTCDVYNFCDRFARCVPDSNTPPNYSCQCNEGFEGDGRRCRATAPCNEVNFCDRNAACVFDENDQGYECVCNDGYRGDGMRCQKRAESTCTDYNDCDRNARCVPDARDASIYNCRCNSGFRGDGKRCQATSQAASTCTDSKDCDQNAQCVRTNSSDPSIYNCRCNHGFRGDGKRCQSVSPAASTCTDSKECDQNAQCVPDSRNPSVNNCRCNHGFRGDGKRCVALAPAASTCTDSKECDQNAQCVPDSRNPSVNNCRCNHGFRGDGKRCVALALAASTCTDSKECDQNAQCVPDPRNPSVNNCRCNHGFRGDGKRCVAPAASTCTDYNDCDKNARCVPHSSDPSIYNCRCNQDFRGDGKRCVPISPAASTCNDSKECDQNAQCVPDPRNPSVNMCRCNQGFRGDGKRCVAIAPAASTCTDSKECDQNAQCVPDPRNPSVNMCRCNQGFRGDGKRCQAVVPQGLTSCTDNDDCDSNARCVPGSSNPTLNNCRCNPGFRGDGKRCVALVKATCTDYNDCDRNARCVTDPRDTSVYICRCNRGFRGDGKRCQQIDPVTCTSYNDCDRNAKCAPTPRNSSVYNCECNQGFRGDGKRCQRIEGSTCTDYNDCDTNARCVPDSSDPSIYNCRCNQGFRGDGKRCQAVTEVPCNQVNNCDRNANCMLNPDSKAYQCVCSRGYEGDGKSCRRKDVIDCRRDPRQCSRDAECVKGSAADSYVCVCKPGYRGNGATCSYVISEGASLLYAQGSKLMRVSVDPQPGDMGQQIAYLSGQMAVGIEVDCKDNNIYWSDVANGVIRRSDMKGENMETILDGLKSPEGVAIDHVARNLFYTDSELDVVQVSTLDGNSIKTLVDTDMVNPRAIVLDISKGTVFWTDWNRNKPQIEKINMDGTDRSILVYNNLRLPNGLAFDSFSQLLCWGDAGEKRIECVLSDGTGRRVVTAAATYPFDITMLNNNIYWSDWKMRNIPSVNQNGGDLNDPLTLAIGGHGRLYGITAVREQCPRVRNACGLNNGGCAFLCLASPNGGRTCACPDGTDPRLC